MEHPVYPLYGEDQLFERETESTATLWQDFKLLFWTSNLATVASNFIQCRQIYCLQLLNTSKKLLLFLVSQFLFF